MPRKCLSCFTPLGGWITSIACTLLLWGLIPSLISTYPRYFLSSAQNVDYQRWRVSPHRDIAWEPPLVCLDGRQGFSLRCRGGHQCKLVHTLRIPLAPSWKKPGEPALPIGNREYLPQRKLMVQIFGCIWIQSNGVLAHVEIKGCCKSEAFKLLQYRAYFGDWKGFYN